MKTLRKERAEFSESEGVMLLEMAGNCIASALNGEKRPQFTGSLAESPVVGVFVSLKRGNDLLRACCGSLSEEQPAAVGELLMAASESAALNDVRFPRIRKEELPHLDLEVSVMHNLKVMPDDPNLRLNSITIGRHGLIISHDRGRGLLLPQVASQNDWDAPTFLEQVCRKANLPPNSWLKTEAELKQFSASIFHRPPQARDVDFRELSEHVAKSVLDFARELVANRANEALEIPRELNTPVSPSGWGILVQTTGGHTNVAFRKDGTLGQLLVEATSGLHQPDNKKDNKIREIMGFSHPVVLHPDDFPRRFGGFRNGIAITNRQGKKFSIVVKNGPIDPVRQLLKQIRTDAEGWQRDNLVLEAHNLLKLDQLEGSKPRVISEPLPELVDGVRPAAVAGKFYPDTEAEMNSELEEFFRKADVEEKVKARAVMLPHAGWKYCGDIIAETLGQIVIPDNIVIVGPKHTPLGARWSVSNARSWKIPGTEIPVDEESASFLASKVNLLEKEELAHQKEHGTEVLLPFLHHLNPKINIIPLAVGSGTHDDFVDLGRGLKAFSDRLAADREDCLFVISSDLNHFADDKTNRKLDKMALDAFITGDTQRLFDTCTKNQISMCGMRPAIAVLSALDLNIKTQFPDIVVVRYETSARVTKDPTSVVGYAGALIS